MICRWAKQLIGIHSLKRIIGRSRCNQLFNNQIINQFSKLFQIRSIMMKNCIYQCLSEVTIYPNLSTDLMQIRYMEYGLCYADKL